MQTTTQRISQLDAKAVAALYDTDLYAWANTNAELLRQGKFHQIDVGHLIEEIQDMGKSQQHAIASHLRNLLMHLLKWNFQPTKQSNSWKFTIRNARQEIDDLVQENPSLSDLPGKVLQRSYAKARQLAIDETGLLAITFPLDCPYAIDQVLSDEWLPS
jgi:Domain of unknown function DUF29